MPQKIIQDSLQLRTKSVNIEDPKEALSIIEALKASLATTEDGMGLAAIQIGIPKRVGVIKQKDEYLYLINPEYVEKLEEIVFVNERCLSLPGIPKDTKRYKQVQIKNQCIKDNAFEEEQLVFYYSPDPTEPGNQGLVTIAVQHEMDHFDGTLITDYDIKGKTIIAEKKIGRNDKCPCGSGKKYKKCCGE